MVRYYGFLSNRKRGELLPKVYEALGIEARKKTEQPGFAALMKALLRTDPYKCILCGNRLRFTGAQAGRHATELVQKDCIILTVNDDFRERLQDKSTQTEGYKK